MNQRMTNGLIVLAAVAGTAGLFYSTKRPAPYVIAPVVATPHVTPITVPAPIATPAPVMTAPLATPVAAAVPPTVPASTPKETPAAGPAAPAGASSYAARAGDTLSQLAAALLGKDSKANRDIVVKANPSLQADPDRVVIGQVYDKTATSEVAKLVVAAPVAESAVAETPKPDPQLKYTAKSGDTVNNLAGALLGGETQTNRDAIVNANKSLQADADHVVAGKTYRIPAPGGLSAATQSSVPAPLAARPTTRPDSDDIIQAAAPRALSYTAKAGDTVTSIAIALLGSDTKANRDAILNTNASLKANPDRVVVGQTYWIPAPVAEVQLTR